MYKNKPSSTDPSPEIDLNVHHDVQSVSDRFAYRTVKFLRFFADTFFAKRYGHRAIVLETVAAVPGMVGGALLHLKALRRMEDDHGWISALLDEAENERMHLMTFIEIQKPTRFERFIVMIAQILYFAFYFLLYLISRKTAHRVVGYMEEEAVTSYTEYLDCIESGEVENVPAPEIAKKYWDLSKNARLRDVVIAVRADEMAHREVNHCIADKIAGGKCDIHMPADISDDIKKKIKGCKDKEMF
ncbi:MAG: alternative oxidase [Alphaproteobacteria bacterium]